MAEANVRRNGSGSHRAGLSRRAGRACLSRRAGRPGPAAYGTAGFLPAEPVAELVFRAERAVRARRLTGQPASCRLSRLRSWSFAPSGPSGPGGLRDSRLPAGWAGAGRTGLRGTHRTTGGARAG